MPFHQNHEPSTEAEPSGNSSVPVLSTQLPRHQAANSVQPMKPFGDGLWNSTEAGIILLPSVRLSVHCRSLVSPPWLSGLKHWNQTLVPVVRAWFEPRCRWPHFAPTRSGVRICGRNCTESVSGRRGPCPVYWARFQIKFCHSTGIAQLGGGVTQVRASTSYA